MENYKNLFIFFGKKVKYFIFLIEVLALAVMCQLVLMRLFEGMSIISRGQLDAFVGLFFPRLTMTLSGIVLIAFSQTCYYLVKAKEWKILFVAIVSNSFLLNSIAR